MNCLSCNFPRVIKRTVACLLLTLLLGGCSTTFTYNQLDWLIPWYVDDYVDLSRDQKQFLKGEIAPILQWHREEELLRYIAILDQVENDLVAPVTAETIHNWIDQVVTAGERIEDSMLKVALEFSTQLSDEQMQEFVASMWNKQEEYEEEYLPRSEEEYIEENAENLEEFLRRFTGRLSTEQQQRLQLAAASMQRFDAIWLEDHNDWLETLVPLLQRPEGWQEAVLVAHANRSANRSLQYQQILDYNMNVVTQGVADVLNDMSDKQRKHMVKEIDSLRTKVRKLTGS